MAGIQNSRSRIFDRQGQSCEPYQHIHFIGDEFIQNLAFKQTDKQFTVEKFLNQEKEFQSSHSFKPITEYNEGTSTLDTFVSNIVEHEPDISPQTEDNLNPYLGLSRHEYDLLKAVKPNSDTTKLMTFALTNKKFEPKKSDSIHKDHPINHLQSIHDHRFVDSDVTVTTKTILRKRKQLLQCYNEPIGPEPKMTKNSNSLWDIKNMDVYKPKPRLGPILNPYTPPLSSDVIHQSHSVNIVSPGTSTTLLIQSDVNEVSKAKNCSRKAQCSGQFYVAPDNCQLTEAELKLIPKFTEEEIQSIPKFQNWNKGTPSKTLYIKNLASNVTELDLASIFQHYQQPSHPKITYRLMRSGKMRDQAFVEFHSVQIAEKALNDRNGICLKDKPIVIQFGRNKS